MYVNNQAVKIDCKLPYINSGFCKWVIIKEPYHYCILVWFKVIS